MKFCTFCSNKFIAIITINSYCYSSSLLCDEDVDRQSIHNFPYMENTTNLCTFVINKVIFISCTLRNNSLYLALLPLFYSEEYKRAIIKMRHTKNTETIALRFWMHLLAITELNSALSFYKFTHTKICTMRINFQSSQFNQSLNRYFYPHLEILLDYQFIRFV